MDFNVLFDHDDLRNVDTLFDMRELNSAVTFGRKTVVEPVRLNERLYSEVCLFRNRWDGKYEEAPSRRFYVQYGELIEYVKDDWELACEYRYYSRQRSLEHAWGAYVLPTNVRLGEELYVRDLIEDVYVSEFWDEPIFAADGIATWDGEKLVFRQELWESSQCDLMG